jgi:hypothetical protein
VRRGRGRASSAAGGRRGSLSVHTQRARAVAGPARTSSLPTVPTNLRMRLPSPPPLPLPPLSRIVTPGLTWLTWWRNWSRSSTELNSSTFFMGLLVMVSRTTVNLLL